MSEKEILKFLGYRDELILDLKDLSDIEFQKREWCSKSKYSFWSNLIMILHNLFDDLDMLDNPKDQIGYSIIDEEECQKINDLNDILDRLTLEVGECKTNEAYLNHPEWPEMAKKAKIAYDAMCENDRKHNIIYPFETNRE